MAGDLNTNLVKLEGTPQGEAIVDEPAVTGLMDMGLHFLPWCKLWLHNMCTWIMRRDRQDVRSRTDYILGTYRRLFQGMAAQDMRHHSNHYMVLGCMRGEPATELTGYLRKAHRFILHPLC